MRIEGSSCVYQGGREYNEDSARCLISGGVCAAVVADGLGGHGGGQIASSIASRYIAETFMKSPEIDTALVRQLFNQANTEVIKAQSPAMKMKSTGVALFIGCGSAIWGHVGDSRLYYFKDGLLVHQTIDHSVSQMSVFYGEITKEQIRFDADRNRILRAFGGEDEIKAEISPIYALACGFHAFLLCTDGFWEYVWELEMEVELAKASTPCEWIKSMTQRIARRVPENHDNFSAAAIFINMKSEGY